MAGEDQTSVGIGSAVFVPPGLLKVSGVAHGGTVTGPTTPVVAKARVADEASTRQKSGAPGLYGRRTTSTEVESTTEVSSRRAAKPESRATRSRYLTGDAKPGNPGADHWNVGVTEARRDGKGARGTTPLGKVAAAATLGRPQPRMESGDARFVAERRSASRNATGPSAGWSCFSRAADAAVSGVA